MIDDFNPGALMARRIALDEGVSVTLRLTRMGDRRNVCELFDACGRELTEFELARLVGFDPRRRLVVCATAFVEREERILGLGSIDLGRDAEPSLVVVRDDHAGLDRLLREALVAHARALVATRAA